MLLDATFRWSSHHHTSHMQVSHHKSELVFLLIMHASGALATPRHDLRYFSMSSIVSAMSASLTLGGMSGSSYLSLRLFFPASRCTVSSCTHEILQWKVHHYLWWNRKTANFRFSCAITETCCPLSGVPLAFLLPGFLMTSQLLWTLLSVTILSLSGLSRFVPWDAFLLLED